VSVFLDRGGLAALYERRGDGVFNLCLRVTGSRESAANATQAAFLQVLEQPTGRAPHDQDLFARLLAAARHAGAASSDHPVRENAAMEPGPVEVANGQLPRRYRDLLALRDLIGCSYDELFVIVGADRRAVAELLWRARLELRDQLEGSRLLSIAAVAEACRRALPLIAMRLDGELRDGDERDQLQGHLRTCGKCRVSQEAMREADAAYRAWPPEDPPRDLAERLLSRAEQTFLSGPAAEPAA
jgi:DNA-directed RNA polymerase specialized sigma24 family protein